MCYTNSTHILFETLLLAPTRGLAFRGFGGGFLAVTVGLIGILKCMHMERREKPRKKHAEVYRTHTRAHATMLTSSPAPARFGFELCVAAATHTTTLPLSSSPSSPSDACLAGVWNNRAGAPLGTIAWPNIIATRVIATVASVGICLVLLAGESLVHN